MTPIVSIYIQSLNELIDLHAKRVSVTLWTRIPDMLFVTVYMPPGEAANTPDKKAIEAGAAAAATAEQAEAEQKKSK